MSFGDGPGNERTLALYEMRTSVLRVRSPGPLPREDPRESWVLGALLRGSEEAALWESIRDLLLSARAASASGQHAKAAAYVDDVRRARAALRRKVDFARRLADPGGMMRVMETTSVEAIAKEEDQEHRTRKAGEVWEHLRGLGLVRDEPWVLLSEQDAHAFAEAVLP